MRVDPLRILKARAEARAILFYQYCAYDDLEEAIAPLRHYALDSGLIDDIDAAEVMKIIYAAFGLPPDGDVTDNKNIVVT